MRRSEFINLWADTVAAGRRKNFPDMRRSEIAASRFHDEKTAVRMWKRHRSSYKDKTVEEARAELTKEVTA